MCTDVAIVFNGKPSITVHFVMITQSYLICMSSCTGPDRGHALHAHVPTDAAEKGDCTAEYNNSAAAELPRCPAAGTSQGTVDVHVLHVHALLRLGEDEHNGLRDHSYFCIYACFFETTLKSTSAVLKSHF